MKASSARYVLLCLAAALLPLSALAAESAADTCRTELRRLKSEEVDNCSGTNYLFNPSACFISRKALVKAADSCPQTTPQDLEPVQAVPGHAGTASVPAAPAAAPVLPAQTRTPAVTAAVPPPAAPSTDDGIQALRREVDALRTELQQLKDEVSRLRGAR